MGTRPSRQNRNDFDDTCPRCYPAPHAIQESGAASSGRSAVHWAHFRALNGMVERQNGHSLVAG